MALSAILLADWLATSEDACEDWTSSRRER